MKDCVYSVLVTIKSKDVTRPTCYSRVFMEKKNAENFALEVMRNSLRHLEPDLRHLIDLALQRENRAQAFRLFSDNDIVNLKIEEQELLA